jgi:prepilin-type N-terminal cleavage/methylation domain-containing protein
MKKKGFTLIELLAVIVILAIIALIATPIVINIINDSKKESINRSIELYLDHVQKMVAKEQMKDPTFNPSECDINEGNLTCDGTPIQIEMKGQTPKSGKIKFSKGMVIEGVNLELDGLYYQVKDDNISEGMTEKIISYSDYITKVSDADNDGKISPGDEYTYQVNNNDTFTFYVLSLEGDKVNLIMDRNICNDGTVNYTRTNNYCRYNWYSAASNNTYGPTTVMAELYAGTKDWDNVSNMIMNYTDENNGTATDKGYTSIITSNGVTTITGKPTTNTSTVGTASKPLKARLPKQSEVMGAGCTTSNGSCPTWLMENMTYYNVSNDKYSMNNNSEAYQNQIYGYWLLSSNPGNSTLARLVGYNGVVDVIFTTNGNCGVRPVITVSTSDLSN